MKKQKNIKYDLDTALTLFNAFKGDKEGEFVPLGRHITKHLPKTYQDYHLIACSLIIDNEKTNFLFYAGISEYGTYERPGIGYCFNGDGSKADFEKTADNLNKSFYLKK